MNINPAGDKMNKNLRSRDVPWYVWAGYSAGIIAWFFNIFRLHLWLFAVAVLSFVGSSAALPVLRKETN